MHCDSVRCLENFYPYEYFAKDYPVQGSATYDMCATLGTPRISNGTQSLPKLHKMFFIIYTEVAPIGATRSIQNSPVVLIEFVHNIRY